MSQLCYTLEEASEALNLSETVLVRLSQFFKVPEPAYEEAGYMSFKGDLMFRDQDLHFFRQVKQRLLAGETLEDVKNRMEAPMPQQTASSEPVYEARVERESESPARAQKKRPVGLAGLRGSSQDSPPPPSSSPIVEVADRAPFEKEAERSFSRYKNAHGHGIGRVFEKMLKEVREEKPKAVKTDKVPKPKPLRPALRLAKPSPEPTENPRPIPEKRSTGMTNPFPFKKSVSKTQDELLWDSVLKQAHQNPRLMNSQLKNAALILRQQATGKTDNPDQKQPGPK